MSRYRFTTGLISLICVIFLITVSPAAAGAVKLLYFNSENPDVFWWRTSSEILQAACDDLDMELEVVYVERNHIKMIEEFTARAKSDSPPNAVIFQNLRTNAATMLKIAEEHKIPAFLFNAGLTDDQIAQFGGPREHFKYWIGQMTPDDAGAGRQLALMLLEKAKSLNLADDKGKVHFVAINGTVSDSAAIERLKGLKQAESEQPDIELHQVVPGFWDQRKAGQAFSGLLGRYPMARVVWCANDPMGLGVIEVMQERGIVPGKEMIVGSIDWTPEALVAVQADHLVATINGHFMETAWAAVLVHDYLKGVDFSEESVSYKSQMGMLSGANIDAYLQYFKTEHFGKADFRIYSKALNPAINQYDFTFESFFSQITPAESQ